MVRHSRRVDDDAREWPCYLSASEAAAELGITTATLYAYVSRGLIASEPSLNDVRSRRYRTEDVQRLQERQELRRNPAGSVREALSFGMPLLESAITLIDEGRLWYRGRDAADLARNSRFEEVVGLLWSGELVAPAPPANDSAPLPELDLPAALEDLARMQVLLPLLAASDPAAYDRRPEATARAGWRILQVFVSLMTGDPRSSLSIAERLQHAWTPHVPDARPLLDAALILWADHELNVSSFTVRCIASAGSPLYAAVAGGLAALLGPKHGGVMLRVEALLAEVGTPERAVRVVADRLRRGDDLPALGHRLYPGGDPRAAVLLELIDGVGGDSGERELALAVIDAAAGVGLEPAIDFAAVAMARVLGLPAGASLGLMAIGRTAGWVAHAIEEYERDTLIRPRASYIGPMPG